jgi:hypothetical protein
MHPAIIQAAAAQQTRDRHARAAADHHAAQARRFRREQRSQQALSGRHDVRGQWVRRALRAA